ncbi:MAG TPA: DUF4173 domain-containing protein [Clostridia bacterium]|nr:DUF4173 domain-containing protein [Clostridia bacterium]
MDEVKNMGTGNSMNNEQAADRKAEDTIEQAAGQTSDNIIGQSDKLIFHSSDKLMSFGALLLGILFVWLFIGKYPGISIPIFVIAFYALLFGYTRTVISKDAKFGWFLSIPVFLLSLTYAIYGNEVLMVLDMLALPVLILLQTILITGVNTFEWHSPGIIIDLIYGMSARCLMHIAKPVKLLASVFKKKSGSKGANSTGLKVLTGLAISVPLLVILLTLLSSADMVFGKLVDTLPNLFENINLGDIIGKTIAALVIFFLSFSYLWSLGHSDRISDNALNGIVPKTPEQRRRWDPVTVITVTITVDILYVIFVVIQFAYLFGSFGLPDGFTYAEYARSGFFELILVSLLNIALLALTLTYTKLGSPAANIAFKVLNSIMIGCTVIMLLSAHYRMSLYEEAYGFTFMRIMTHAFMVLLLVLFVITLARVWYDRLPLLKPYIIAALIAFTAVNYINVDEMIAKNNIKRYYTTGEIDMYYFHSLSCSVVDDLMKLAKDKNSEVSDRAVEMLGQRKDAVSRLNKNWQSFNLTNYLAQKDLEKGW